MTSAFEDNDQFRVAVVIATFGSDIWEEQGDWASGKLLEQTVVPPLCRVHSPNGTLSEARNEAARTIATDPAWEDTEWIVFLDADDELDPGFIEAILEYQGDADILQTAVRGFTFSLNDERVWLDPTAVLHEQKFPLLRQNYLTIGSPIRKELFERVGGFDPWPVLEDWALWLKCSNAGAKFDELYDAVYWINDAHVRNLQEGADDVARQIRATYQ